MTYHWESEGCTRRNTCWKRCSSALKDGGADTTRWTGDRSIGCTRDLNRRGMINRHRAKGNRVRSTSQRSIQTFPSTREHHESARLDGIDSTVSKYSALIFGYASSGGRRRECNGHHDTIDGNGMIRLKTPIHIGYPNLSDVSLRLKRTTCLLTIPVPAMPLLPRVVSVR